MRSVDATHRWVDESSNRSGHPGDGDGQLRPRARPSACDHPGSSLTVPDSEVNVRDVARSSSGVTASRSETAVPGSSSPTRLNSRGSRSGRALARTRRPISHSGHTLTGRPSPTTSPAGTAGPTTSSFGAAPTTHCSGRPIASSAQAAGRCACCAASCPSSVLTAGTTRNATRLARGVVPSRIGHERGRPSAHRVWASRRPTRSSPTA